MRSTAAAVLVAQRARPWNGAAAAWNSALAGHVRAGELAAAEALFEEMGSLADAVSWNIILTGLRRAGDVDGALRHFLRMGRAGVRPTASTMATAIAAAAEGGAPAGQVPQLHAVALRSAELSSSPFVGTALVGGYAKARDPAAARQAFDEMLVKNAITWTALISGLMEAGCPADARRAFNAMPVKSVPAWTAIVDGHMRNGDPGEARRCFDGMPLRNVVSWTALIKGYVRNGMFAEAFNLFVEMRKTPGAAPNEFTFSAVLGACAGSSSLRPGESVHADLTKSGPPPDAILVSSLVDMYSKCGDAGAAARAFESHGHASLVSWNAIISCYARHGLGARALAEFQRMTAAGVAPDHVTFISVLAACARGGLVREGERWFRAMEGEFGLRPRVEHYACMVDLLGRAGELRGALRLVEEMPLEPDLVVLGALATAGGMHGGLELLGLAAERIGEDHPAVFAMLKRAYGETGAWDRVAEVRRRMGSAAMRLQRATSRIS